MLTATAGASIPITLFISLSYLSRIAFLIGSVYLFILLVKALRKYLGTGSRDPETAAVRKSLGEAIKEHRTACGMTQEFVAEHLGVSRQAVSKWENGTSDPSTANLLALCKLYGISAADLLREVEQ